jgi:hypothetical protein
MLPLPHEYIPAVSVFFFSGVNYVRLPACWGATIKRVGASTSMERPAGAKLRLRPVITAIVYNNTVTITAIYFA